MAHQTNQPMTTQNYHHQDKHLNMDFDESRLYFSHQQLTGSNEGGGENHGEQEVGASIDLQAVRRHFREFLRKCCVGLPLSNCRYNRFC